MSVECHSINANEVGLAPSPLFLLQLNEVVTFTVVYTMRSQHASEDSNAIKAKSIVMYCQREIACSPFLSFFSRSHCLNVLLA